MTSSPGIERRLIEAAQRGDSTSIETLCSRLIPVVRQSARRFAPPLDVDDLSQDAMIKVLLSLNQLRQPERIVQWVRQITRNCGVSALRTLHREGDLSADVSSDEVAMTPVTSDDNRLVEKVMLAIGQLPSRLRETARLAYLIGLRHERIADRLNLPIGTVKSRLSTSRHQIKAEVKIMSEQEFSTISDRGAPTIDVKYGNGPVPRVELRGYGMFFGSVLEVGVIEEVAFYDYPGPILTLVAVSEVRRKVNLFGRDAYEVMIRHVESEPDHPTVADYFEITPTEIRALMRTTIRGQEPHLQINEGSSRWQPMPRYLGGASETAGWVVRNCDVRVDDHIDNACVSAFDLGNTGSPAEHIYRLDGRQILHRRYTGRANAEKRELGWDRLPPAVEIPEEAGELRRWYDSVLLNR